MCGGFSSPQAENFEIIRLGNAIAFAKIMLFERFRNVVQAILTAETTKISGLRPDSRKSIRVLPLAKIMFQTQ